MGVDLSSSSKCDFDARQLRREIGVECDAEVGVGLACEWNRSVAGDRGRQVPGQGGNRVARADFNPSPSLFLFALPPALLAISEWPWADETASSERERNRATVFEGAPVVYAEDAMIREVFGG